MPDRAHLHQLLSDYLDGEIPLYELRSQFYSNSFATQVSEKDEGLYRSVHTLGHVHGGKLAGGDAERGYSLAHD